MDVNCRRVARVSRYLPASSSTFFKTLLTFLCIFLRRTGVLSPRFISIVLRGIPKQFFRGEGEAPEIEEDEEVDVVESVDLAVSVEVPDKGVIIEESEEGVDEIGVDGLKESGDEGFAGENGGNSA